MKKAILIISVSLIFLQCNKSDETPPEEINNELASYSLFVDGTFFPPNSSGRLIISDSNGDILSEGDLVNNQTTTLDVITEPNGIYDLTIFAKLLTNGTNLNYIFTYEDILAGDYSFGNFRGNNPNADEITITLTNSGTNMELISSTGYLDVTNNPSNGGTHILNGFLSASPGNYYASFKKDGEPMSRYMWNTALNGNTDIDADFATLPLVDGLSSIQLPDYGTSFFLRLSGVKNDDPVGLNGVRHNIQGTDYNSGVSSATINFPEGLFDAFETSLSYSDPNDNKNFIFSNKSTGIPAALPEPTLDFNIINSSFSNFSATTTGEYDYFSASFNIWIPAQDLLLIYEIYGKPSPEVMISKVNLFNNLFADNSDVNSDVLDSLEVGFGITNYSQLSSYNEFLQSPLIYRPTVLTGDSVEDLWINFD